MKTMLSTTATESVTIDITVAQSVALRRIDETQAAEKQLREMEAIISDAEKWQRMTEAKRSGITIKLRLSDAKHYRE